MSWASRKALLIGVPKNQHSEDLSFDFTTETSEIENIIENDFQRLTNVLEDIGYEVEPPVGLECQSRLNLLNALAIFLKSLSTEDVAIVYLSGHGISYQGNGFLIPFDADRDFVESDAKRLVDNFICLTDPAFVNHNARHVLFCFNVCREVVEPVSTMSGVGIQLVDPEIAHDLSRSKTSILWACENMRHAYFDRDVLKGSFFATAFADAMSRKCPEVSLAGIEASVNLTLERLSKERCPNRPVQSARLFTETESRSFEISKSAGEADLAESEWSAHLKTTQIWNSCSKSGLDSEGVMLAIDKCDQHRKHLKAISPWNDEQYLTRIIDVIQLIIRWSEDSGIERFNREELLLLLVTPFFREACLAESIASLRGHLETEDTDGSPLGLALARKKNDRFLARIESLDEERREMLVDWFVHAIAINTPETWRLQGTIQSVMSHIDAGNLLRGILSPQRVLSLARCMNASNSGFHSTGLDELQALEIVDEGKGTEAKIRTQMLGMVLAISSGMSIDIRNVDKVVVDHLGTVDEVNLDDLRTCASRAKWKEKEKTRVLTVTCPHPAIDLALASLTEKLDDLRGSIMATTDIASVATCLPAAFRAEITPKRDDSGLTYSKPHVRLRLSHESIKELLLGEQLYGDSDVVVRELYQNALDACRYAQARNQYARLRRIQVDEYKGNVRFTQTVRPDGRWQLDCEDNGVGMDRSTIVSAFATAGESFRTSSTFLGEQFNWKQLSEEISFFPNSQFGIGVFSYFMVASEVQVFTRATDEFGRPLPELLRISVSNSGSLFRIKVTHGKGDTTNQEDPQCLNGGTCLRLIMHAQEKPPIACVTDLRKWLWVAEFKTTAVQHHGTRRQEETWHPNQLSKLSPVAEHAVTGSEGRLWWLPTPSGVILGDGIYIGEQQHSPYAIVNLCGEQRPKLNVDRSTIIEYDQKYARRLIGEGLPGLVEADWCTYEWLWSAGNERSAQMMEIESALMQHKAQIRIGVLNQTLPVTQAKVFPPDQQVARLLTSRREVILRKHTLPLDWLCERISLFRFLLAGGTGISRFGMQEWQNETRLALSTSGSAADAEVDNGIVAELSPGQLLFAAKSSDGTVSSILNKLMPFQALGIILPEMPANACQRVDDKDLILVSKHHDGAPPWVPVSVSVDHVLDAALAQGTSPSGVVRQLKKIPLMRVPASLDTLKEVSWNNEHSLFVSLNGNGAPPARRKRNLSIDNIYEISKALGMPSRRVCKLALELKYLDFAVPPSVRSWMFPEQFLTGKLPLIFSRSLTKILSGFSWAIERLLRGRRLPDTESAKRLLFILLTPVFVVVCLPLMAALTPILMFYVAVRFLTGLFVVLTAELTPTGCKVKLYRITRYLARSLEIVEDEGESDLRKLLLYTHRRDRDLLKALTSRDGYVVTSLDILRCAFSRKGMTVEEVRGVAAWYGMSWVLSLRCPHADLSHEMLIDDLCILTENLDGNGEQVTSVDRTHVRNASILLNRTEREIEDRLLLFGVDIRRS